MAGSLRTLVLVAALGAAACSPTATQTPPGEGSTSASGGGGAGGGPDFDAGTGDPSCQCPPGVANDRIYVMSDDAQIWTYDPVGDTFDVVTQLGCGADAGVFSMAVDAHGTAWALLAESEHLLTVDLEAPKACADPGYVPGQQGFGLFGMAFAASSGACPKLYVHSYSGSGPFREGPSIGTLGVIDPKTLTLTAIAPIDYDGGELAGTGDGRLFAFAGADPAKLVEYDPSTGAALHVTPLGGLSKTQASAFAFYGGAAYFFTEAPPADCGACLEGACGDVYAECLADEVCAAGLACALEAGDVSDACGGAMPAELQACLAGECLDECLPNPGLRTSQVTRLDFDADPPALTVVHPKAPIRVVGAGASPCVPFTPP